MPAGTYLTSKFQADRNDITRYSAAQYQAIPTHHPFHFMERVMLANFQRDRQTGSRISGSGTVTANTQLPLTRDAGHTSNGTKHL